MDMQLIKHICQIYSLGEQIIEQKLLTSGLVNEVCQVQTNFGEYIIKSIDLSSVRARTIDEYRNIERLTAYMHSKGIPTITALQQHDDYILAMENDVVVIVYPWIEGEIICGHTGPMMPVMAEKSGRILGKIHKIQLRNFATLPPFGYEYFVPNEKLEYLIATANAKKLKWAIELENKLDDFLHWNAIYASANKKLNGNRIYSHGDYFPHNLLWFENKATLIDWELAGLINPGLELILGLILFSGFATEKQFGRDALVAFLHGYYSAGAKLEDHIEDAYWGALGKGWLNWIAYNMQRSLNKKLPQTDISLATQNVIDVYHNLNTMIEKMPTFISMVRNL